MWLMCKVAAAGAAAAIASAGCTASTEASTPLQDELFFPTGAAASPDGTTLFVTNANSDLRYNSGSIAVVSLAKVEESIEPWLQSRSILPDGGLCATEDDRNAPCCEQDPDFTETLVCEEKLFLRETIDAGVRIGNFATDIAVQDLGGGALRLVVPTRGDPAITWADWLPEGRLSCDPQSEGAGKRFQLCDEAHRLSFVLNDDEIGAIPEEPFGVMADSGGEFAMVTHLTSGAVTLIDSPKDGPAVITDIALGVFDADPATGARGATGIAGRTPYAGGDIVYVGSRSEDRIQTFTVGRSPNTPPYLLMGRWFFLNGVGNNDEHANSGSNDTRGMAFSPSGDRLYLVNRKPPSLQIYDTSLAPSGVPRNELVGAVDICRQASTITVMDSGDGERVYLSCFQDGQIYVVDPRGRGRVEDIITVGRGPYSVVAPSDGKRLYVTNFLEDTVAVIDLIPGSPTRHRVVLRIGVPKPL